MQLADFGLSRVLETNGTHVSTQTHGTLAYQPGAPQLPVQTPPRSRRGVRKKGGTFYDQRGASKMARQYLTN